jgi:hypothetical protein
VVLEMTRTDGGPLSRATTAVAALWVCNFFVFCLLAQLLGGDALNGTIVEGRYYLADHGFLTEVGSGTWWYSRVHAQVVLLGGVLVLLSAVVTRPRGPLPTYALPVVLGGMVATAMAEFLKAARGPAGNLLVGVSVLTGITLALVAAYLMSRHGVKTLAVKAAEQVDEADSRRSV